MFLTCFPNEYRNLFDTLNAFSISKQEIKKGGGGKTGIAQKFDSSLRAFGWEEKSFDVTTSVGGKTTQSSTHKIDHFKNRVGIELEWNNKDTFFDRDLNNFRLLHSCNVLSVGVIVTRCSELQGVFKKLDEGGKYGASTTHLGKLIPKIRSGAAGTCPLLIVGIKKECCTL